jgi:enoyl-CoA hydratase/carnithine racemase
MSDPLVSFETRNGVVYAQIDNYARRNALSGAIMKQLSEGTRQRMVDDGASVVVVSGSGGIFSSGVDVTTVQAQAEGEVIAPYLQFTEFGNHLAAFGALPMVKIAKIEGFCFGAGVVLASYCDVRFSAEETTFCLPELDLGSPFSGGGFDRLAYFFGHTKIVDLILTARRFPAAEAATAGFLTNVVPAPSLDQRVTEYAEALAARPRFLLMQTILASQVAVAASVRTPSTEFGGAMLAAFDERSRAQNHAFSARFTGRTAT